MPVLIDATHVRGKITGIERITTELFTSTALAPLPVVNIEAASVADMIRRQQIDLPWMLLQDKASILICPGFPPAIGLYPFRRRIIPYIHDTFLISRWADLNIRAKVYMVVPFRLAVSACKTFFVNSEATRSALQSISRPDAEIELYRPEVTNTFDVSAELYRSPSPKKKNSLKLVAIGTIEPRKNYRAMVHIIQALRERGIDASVTIAGREGWGSDWDYLQRAPGVTLLGYSSAQSIREALESADMFISTSHDEGLGLPLLEAQHAGLAIVAPDKPVFREVLGKSGIMIDPSHPPAAAEKIIAFTASPDWRQEAALAAVNNLARWNGSAAQDRVRIIGYLSARLRLN